MTSTLDPNLFTIESQAFPGKVLQPSERARERRNECRSARLWVMVFGQQSGPPASARDVKELLSLFQDLGHIDFRDARGPMGLTQRQAAGKFTREEAAALIEQLSQGEADGNAPVAARPTTIVSAVEQAMRHMPAEQLAAELTRRGWTVIAP
jgi:hypothetical protein